MRAVVTMLFAALLAASPAPAQAPAAEAAAPERAGPRVEVGRRVSIEYTLRLEDGSIADSNAGHDPLVYAHGAGSLLPGLERALDGMALGESKQGTLAPGEAYGQVDPELFQEVETARIPEADRRVGARLFYRDPDGERQLVRVYEIRGEKIVVDMNHPLAGNPIRYEVKVLKIE